MSKQYELFEDVPKEKIGDGFERTRLGCIPIDWELKKLEEVAYIQGGFAFKSKDFLDKGLYQVIKMGNLYSGTLNLKKTPAFLDSITEQQKQFLLKREDILFTLTGTIGKRDYGYSIKIKEEKNLLLNQRLCRLVINNKLADSDFVSFFIQTKIFQDRFFLASKGGTGNQANVGISDVAKLKIILPPLPEQQKIAQILSTWDKAIETTEKLIEAKTKLKKGLMQRLLTGQTRFKGFQESWTQYEFGQLAKLCTLKFDPKKESKIYKCIELEHLSQETGQLLGFTYSNLQLSQKNKFESRDVLFGKLRPYLRKYFNPDFEGVCSSEIWVLKGFPSLCDNKFLFYLVQSHEFIQLANSTTGTKMPRADWDFLSEFPFRLPPLPEQQKIAQILTACDQEIELLSKKLEKLKQQKKGLMQKLLTGQIRVQLSEQD